MFNIKTLSPAIEKVWFRSVSLDGPEVMSVLFPLWYRTSADFDNQIKTEFGNRYYKIDQGSAIEYYRDTPEEALRQPQTAQEYLHLIILLDQFPRNAYRLTPSAFATDSIARELSKSAIKLNKHLELHPYQQMFIFLPLEHSENMEDQELCIKMCESVDAKYGLVKWAKEHYDIIKRFGRFPHRNKVLGRESTAEEVEYLKNADSFGQ